MSENEEPERPRSQDAPMELETMTHRGWGTLLATCALLVAFAAGVWFLVVYWTGGNNQWLGATLAICLGGFGVALVLWSHFLMDHREATDPREDLPSSPVELEKAQNAFCGGVEDIHRRRLLKWASVGGAGLLGAMVISLFRSMIGNPEDTLYRIVWKRGQRLVTLEGKPVTVGTLRAGDSTIVFPEGSVGDQRAQTVLVRVQKELLNLPADRADWAPLGYLAYSRVCTHAGCTVGLWEPTTHLLLCPCHQSTFDVLRAATPTAGPAARPLPQLPLYADASGALRAGGSFSQRPGPGFWGLQ